MESAIAGKICCSRTYALIESNSSVYLLTTYHSCALQSLCTKHRDESVHGATISRSSRSTSRLLPHSILAAVAIAPPPLISHDASTCGWLRQRCRSATRTSRPISSTKIKHSRLSEMKGNIAHQLPVTSSKLQTASLEATRDSISTSSPNKTAWPVDEHGQALRQP